MSHEKKAFLTEKEKIISHRGHRVHREKRKKMWFEIFALGQKFQTTPFLCEENTCRDGREPSGRGWDLFGCKKIPDAFSLCALCALCEL